MAPWSKDQKEVTKIFPVTFKSSSGGNKNSQAAALCQWSEVPQHPGLVCCLTHSGGVPVVLMIKPHQIQVLFIAESTTVALGIGNCALVSYCLVFTQANHWNEFLMPNANSVVFCRRCDNRLGKLFFFSKLSRVKIFFNISTSVSTSSLLKLSRLKFDYH